jgi:hypothetical protein
VSVQYERIKDTRWYFCQTGKKAKNNKELSRTPKKSKRAEREGMQGKANKQWFCVCALSCDSMTLGEIYGVTDEG